MIYGFRYPRSGDDASGEKGIVKNDIFDVFNYVSATYAKTNLIFKISIGVTIL